jgi:xanthine dehydrogenase YagS FAD-binding subunit
VGAVAVAVDLHDGSLRDVRIALGAVAPRPWRARIAEDLLRGGAATPEAFGSAIHRELAQAEPLPDNAFKVALSSSITVSALCGLCGLAEKPTP